jgi:tetratricopeptide (TPR) repeat protein
VRIRFLIVFLALLTGPVWAQDSADKPDKPAADPSASDKAADQAPPSENSSSHDTRIDVRPPQDDAKNHPGSKDAVAGLDVADNPGKTDISSDASDVREFHPWNPLKAIKDVEVGDYYFRRKNYKGALERYKDALYYKEGDAVASFRLAECQEKLGDKSEAKKYYEQYLKILPDGPFAKEARTSLARLAKAQ